jgi:hypothetical protein
VDSNPSPGADVEGISECYKSDQRESGYELMKEHHHSLTAKNPKTPHTHTQLQHECAQTEQKVEALERVIDSITQDFSRLALNAQL